jgi:hypothetical protein
LGAAEESGRAPSIHLTIAHQKYCLCPPGMVDIEHQPRGAVSLRIKFKTEYQNTREEPLIARKWQRISALISSQPVEVSAPLGRKSSNKRDAAGQFVTRFKLHDELQEEPAPILTVRPSPE